MRLNSHDRELKKIFKRAHDTVGTRPTPTLKQSILPIPIDRINRQKSDKPR